MVSKTSHSYRTLSLGKDGENAFDSLLQWLAGELSKKDLDRWALCRDFLFQIHGGPGSNFDEAWNQKDLSPVQRARLACFDAHNITLEAERYVECEEEKFARVKPLLWMWQSFDQSPLGRNVALGVDFRRLLAPFIFKKIGKNVKFFHDVEFSFGYNLSIGDDSVVHRKVLLDDRGSITLGDHVSVSDYVNIYSHSHGVLDYDDVTCGDTSIGDWTRLAYHATVMSGVKIGKDVLVGAHAVVNRDTPDHHVIAGIPAKTISVKKR